MATSWAWGAAIGLGFRLLEPDTVIGREVSADIQLSSTTVSRRHALVKMIGEEVTIEDLGSRNGTFVDMDQVKTPRVLRDGDHITVGDSTLLKLAYAVDVETAIMRAAFESAKRDPETTACNRFLLGDLLRSEHAYARRHGSPLALVFFRIGDVAADPPAVGLIRQAAVTIREVMRTDEPLARLNGDLVALLRATQEEAASMAERVRSRAAGTLTTPPRERDRPDAEGQNRHVDAGVALSVAVVPIGATDAVASEALLASAHERAREAFDSGKGGVLIAGMAAPADPAQGTP
jgi:GGDEF domain-containing protein